MSPANLSRWLLASGAFGTLASFGFAEPYTIARHELHPSAAVWFDTVAGQGYDGIIFDNKKAQTFVATRSGFVESVSAAVYRTPGTTAALRIRITDVLAGVPHAALAEAYVDASEVPTSFEGMRPYLNVSADITSATLLLAEGRQYGLVFDSTEPEANYRIHGGYSYPYPDGTRFRSQNSTVWTEVTSGDLFFGIEASSPAEIRAFDLAGNGSVRIFWADGLGRMWVEQSTNLVDWAPVAGPMTHTNVWSGTVCVGRIGFFRIRQTE